MVVTTEGLEGVVACESSISSIEGDDLRFRGINIDELVAHSNFEETAYLLLHGKLPTKQQLDLFKERLNEHSFDLPSLPL
jgi:citrate synthase